MEKQEKKSAPTLWVVNFLPSNGESSTYGPFPSPEKAQEWMRKDVELFLERIRESHSPEELEGVPLKPESPNEWSTYLDFLDENPWWEVTDLRPVTD